MQVFTLLPFQGGLMTLKLSLWGRLFLVAAHAGMVAVAKESGDEDPAAGVVLTLLYLQFVFCVFVPAVHYLANGDMAANMWKKFRSVMPCRA